MGGKYGWRAWVDSMGDKHGKHVCNSTKPLISKYYFERNKNKLNR